MFLGILRNVGFLKPNSTALRNVVCNDAYFGSETSCGHVCSHKNNQNC